MKLYRSKAQGDIAGYLQNKKEIKLKIFLKFRKESKISKLTYPKPRTESRNLQNKRKKKLNNFFFIKFRISKLIFGIPYN
jgi:hypothetical protein